MKEPTRLEFGIPIDPFAVCGSWHRKGATLGIQLLNWANLVRALVEVLCFDAKVSDPLKVMMLRVRWPGE
ncbi:hypothetical protein RJT34_23923 [Clitoria ternatea]|uniref:Uncharacterized protein n=1 Tax=Clitoria ternatea TaxID=43366 RepID=A0AAN9FNL6_CLITE